MLHQIKAYWNIQAALQLGIGVGGEKASNHYVLFYLGLLYKRSKLDTFLFFNFASHSSQRQ